MVGVLRGGGEGNLIFFAARPREMVACMAGVGWTLLEPNRWGTSGTTYECVPFCRRPVVVVVIIVVDCAVVGGATHVLHDGRHWGATSLAERLQQRRKCRLAGGQGRRQGAAERQKFLARHVLVDRNGGIVLYNRHITQIITTSGRRASNDVRAKKIRWWYGFFFIKFFFSRCLRQWEYSNECRRVIHFYTFDKQRSFQNLFINMFSVVEYSKFMKL